jgi:hypothetical protein
MNSNIIDYFVLENEFMSVVIFKVLNILTNKFHILLLRDSNDYDSLRWMFIRDEIKFSLDEFTHEQNKDFHKLIRAIYFEKNDENTFRLNERSRCCSLFFSNTQKSFISNKCNSIFNEKNYIEKTLPERRSFINNHKFSTISNIERILNKVL